MRIPSLFLVAVLGATTAFTQSVNQTYLTGLVDTLNGLGLTALVQVVTSALTTPQGSQLFSGLSTTAPYTVFAPTNNAWSGVNPFFTNDPNWLVQAFAYHIIPETVALASVPQYPNIAVFPTVLDDTSIVHLYGNRSQNIGLTSIGSVTQIARQNSPAVVMSTATYENLLIYVLSAVIDLPPGFNFFIADPTGLSGVPSNYSLADFAQFISSQIPSLSTEPSLTIFAPIDQAFVYAQQIGLLPTDSTTTQNIISNHIINGTVVTTGSPQKNYTSAGGETITVGTGGLTDGSGSVVYYRGEHVANIVYGDIIVQNGIVHLIDVVLPNTASDPSTAQQAVSSYSQGATSTLSLSPAKRTMVPSRWFRF